MFYSHQLLARKAPLGQIWMAATLHAKINRRKLDKLNLIKICEEILNPAVPMALRLSGILMGGVVIVYQRKVKLLYDDVHRLLVEINEAWKVKSSKADPTVLPKGRTQARYEAVTMQDDASVEMQSEQILHHSTTTGATEGFQGFLPMGLDRVSDTYIHINAGEDDMENNHQADPETITLLDDYGSCMPEADPFSRFERFDTEGESEIHFSITPEDPHVPTTLLPSPQKESPKDFPLDDEFKGPEQEPQNEQDPNGFPEIPKEVGHNMHHERPAKRKARARSANVIMDNELTIVPGHVYQSWLNDTSDIVSTKGGRKKSINPISSMKIISVMELPPLVLLTGLNKVTGELHYPKALMELERKSVHPKTANCSPSVRLSPDRTAAASSPPWPSERVLRQESRDPLEFPVEDFARGFDSHEMLPSIEKLRNNLGNLEQQALEAALRRNQFDTPGGASDRSVPSIHSSGSGHSFPRMDVEVQLHSGRSRKRLQSSSKHSLGGLDPVEEEIPWEQNGRDPKLRRLNENGATPDLELLEETAPSPTPKRFYERSMNEITRSIQTHLKLHFDTLGAPPFESLDQLTSGMNRRKAAQLFYQTCGIRNNTYIWEDLPTNFGIFTLNHLPPKLSN